MRVRFAKEAVLGAAGLLLSLVVVEIAFRLGSDYLKPHVPRGDRPQLYFVSELSRSPRDFLYAKEKPAETFRIVVIGDSFTFGSGVLFDDAFPKRLERILNLNLHQPKVEVLNFGVPGYSSRNEGTLLSEVLSDYNPDFVLLEVTLNDPELNPYRFAGGPMRERMGKFTMSGALYDHWKSLGFVVARLHNWRSRYEYQDYFLNLFRKPETLQNFKSSIEHMAKICSQRGVPIAAVTFPLFTFPLDEHYPFFEAHQIISDTLKQQKISNLDLFESFRGMNAERLQTEPGADPHPSEIAHRIAAESIYTWFSSEKFIPPAAVVKLTLKKRENPLVLK